MFNTVDLDIDKHIIYLNKEVSRIAPDIKGFEKNGKLAKAIVADLDEVIDELSDIADLTIRVTQKVYTRAVALIDHGYDLLFSLEEIAIKNLVLKEIKNWR